MCVCVCVYLSLTVVAGYFGLPEWYSYLWSGQCVQTVTRFCCSQSAATGEKSGGKGGAACQPCCCASRLTPQRGPTHAAAPLVVSGTRTTHHAPQTRDRTGVEADGRRWEEYGRKRGRQWRGAQRAAQKQHREQQREDLDRLYYSRLIGPRYHSHSRGLH